MAHEALRDRPPRSFGLNDEANLNIYNGNFARRQIEVFQADLAKSHRITIGEWQARPWQQKLTEQIESLLGAVM